MGSPYLRFHVAQSGADSGLIHREYTIPMPSLIGINLSPD
jgi:hypothetical protein